MKKLAILYSNYTPTIDAIIGRLKENCEIVCFDKDSDELKTFDLIVDVNFGYSGSLNILKVHHSLLPAFFTNEPVKQAIIAGVKVTGLTFYYTNPHRIIAQYPVFIPNEAHFDDVEQELLYLEQTLYPLIIEKILKNEVIDIKTLIKSQSKCNGCSGGNCSGC